MTDRGMSRYLPLAPVPPADSLPVASLPADSLPATIRSARILPAILLVASGLALPGCLRDAPSPVLGSCTDYPAGSYDYGDIPVGDCLAAPTDLKIWQGASGPVLSVVNSNAYLLFASGSLLNLDLDNLEARLDDAIRNAPPPLEDQKGVPPVLLLGDLRTAGTSSPAGIGSYPLPNFNGKVVFGELPSVTGSSDPQTVAFVSNRLSVTTDYYLPDYVYALDMSSPLSPAPFDVTDGASPVDSNAIIVGKDAYGMAWADTSKGRYLYVVNETSHSVSVVRTTDYPVAAVLDPRAGVVTDPVFHDVGPSSFVELGGLAVTEQVLSDNWTLSMNEGTYRTWYVGNGTWPGGAVGVADSGNGLSFKTLNSSPGLTPGSADAWDSFGIGRVSVLVSFDAAKYYIFYEGKVQRANSDPGVYLSRIGLATSDGTATGVTRFDPQSNENDADDYLVGAGSYTGDFDLLGAGAPWATARGSNYVLWYTGTDADNKRSLGLTSSPDLVNFKRGAQLKFFLDPGLTVPASSVDAGDEQFDATGFWDEDRDRYRLWYIARHGATDCLTYAESPDGTNYKLGSLDREDGGEGCLELGITDPILSTPSVIREGHILRLWVESASADDPDADWTLHYARGFDSIHWQRVDSSSATTHLGDGMAWEGGNPMPTVLKLTPGDNAALVGAQYASNGVQMPVNQGILALYNNLAFTMFYGHVLGTGTHGSVTSNTDTGESQHLGSQAWDSRQVSEPGYDVTTGQLYYSGQDAAGIDSIGIATPGSGSLYRQVNAAQPVLTGRPSATGETSSAEPAPKSYLGPSIVQVGDTTYLYFTYGLTSSNGRVLEQGEIRVLTRQGSSAWDSTKAVTAVSPTSDETLVSAPTVVAPASAGQRWHMWFSSVDVEGQHRIAYASSSDGLTWTRAATDAGGAALYALETGGGGTWDDAGVEAPVVLRDAGGVYHMWYDGSNGSVTRIGYATASPAEGQTEETMVWERYLDPDTNEPAPVLSNESGWWDADGLLAPEVVFQEGRYRMWYEGRLGANHRIGAAESFDGMHWVKVFDPLSVDDSLTFSTRNVYNDGYYDEPSNVVNGAISLYLSSTYTGVGATEIALSPDQSIAVVGARYTPAVYVIDTRDDSANGVFDANYNGIEAMIPLNVQTSVSGTRSAVFSPTGQRFYMTTANPDSVLVFDRTRIPDTGITQVLTSGVILGAIPMDVGVAQDQGVKSSADVGPISPVIAPSDGRYMWVANANSNSVFTIDLTRGAFGEVVAVAKDVGELPVSLALSPDERYLFVANYVGEIHDEADDRHVANSTMAVIDADRSSPTFGQLVARIKNQILD